MVNDNQMIIKNARLAFPDLWVAKEFEAGDGKFRYSATLLLPKDSPQVAQINAMALKLFKDKFKEKGDVHYNAANGDKQKYCLHDGDKKVYDGFAGNWALTAVRRAESGPPKVVARDAVTELKQGGGKPYAGSFVNAKVSFWLQEGKFEGFRCTLETVQYVGDGDAFSGAAPATTEGMEPLPEDEGELV